MNRLKSRISKQEDGPCYNWQEDARRLGREKSNMVKGEMGKGGVFWRETFNLDGSDGSRCYWHGLGKKEAAVFKNTIWKRISYGLGSFFCVWKGWFRSDGRERKNSDRYVNVLEKRLPIYESPRNHFFNWKRQPYTFLSSRNTGLKQKIMMFWTGH